MSNFLFLLFFVSLNIHQLVAQDKYFKLGKELSLTNYTSISQLYSEPDKYFAQKVMIEGRVIDVCEKDGCWMIVEEGGTAYPEVKIRIESNDFCFPFSAYDKHVKVEGYFYFSELRDEDLGMYTEFMLNHTGTAKSYIRLLPKIFFIKVEGMKVFLPPDSYSPLNIDFQKELRELDQNWQKWQEVEQRLLLNIIINEFNK
jgi:hypothetical protein